MENADKIINDLLSDNLDIQSNAIKVIKEDGDLSIVKPLIAFLEKHYEHSVESVVVSILSDTKDSKIREIVADCIASCQNPILKASLLRITWESSLDYSEYLDMFINSVLNDDFTPALEASTYLENSTHFLNAEERQLVRIKLGHIQMDRMFLAESVFYALDDCEKEESTENPVE